MANISYLWHDSGWYNFLSSEAGGICVKVVGLILFGFFVRWLKGKIHEHLECHVAGCERLGHPVHGTSFRACKPHHPHLDPDGHSAEHIRAVALDSKPDPTLRRQT